MSKLEFAFKNKCTNKIKLLHTFFSTQKVIDQTEKEYATFLVLVTDSTDFKNKVDQIQAEFFL